MRKRVENKIINVNAIVHHFGGKHLIVDFYKNILNTHLSEKAVEKWIERNSVPVYHLLNLKTISDKKSLKFSIDSFIT